MTAGDGSRRGRTRIPIAIAIVALLLAGCSALLDLSPLDFVDRAADAAPAEGGDGIAPDAPARDAAADADADAPTGCSFVDAEFCDDFDHGDPLSVRWTSKAIQGDASIDPSTTRALSGTTSLRGEGLPPPAPYLAFVNKEFPGYADRFFLSYDMLFAVAPSNGTFLAQASLTPTYGNNNDALNPMIAAFPADAGIAITAFNLKPFTGNQGLPLATVPLGKWIHVEASVRRDVQDGGANATLRFVVDGVPITRTVPWEAPATTPTVYFGPQSGNGNVELYYDNVVMDTR